MYLYMFENARTYEKILVTADTNTEAWNIAEAVFGDDVLIFMEEIDGYTYELYLNDYYEYDSSVLYAIEE